MIKPTSRESYKEVKQSGMKKTQEEMILEAFEGIDRETGWTRAELAAVFGDGGILSLAQKGTLAARIKGMIDKKLLMVTGYRLCIVTKRRVEILNLYRVKPLIEQKELF